MIIFPVTRAFRSASTTSFQLAILDCELLQQKVPRLGTEHHLRFDELGHRPAHCPKLELHRPSAGFVRLRVRAKSIRRLDADSAP